MDPTPDNATTGLVLTGGGARAAYQVGVLKAIARIRREVRAPRHNPFGVIAGTSAGAINAAAIACHADRFDLAVAGVVHIWRQFSAEQVYRADAFGVVRTGARWLTMLTLGWAIARWRRERPRSLLDNSPLAELLARVVQLERLPELLNAGHLSALAITGSSYSSGDHVTFCQTARPFAPWLRSQRTAVPCTIGLPHLMASSAIPFVFPAVRLPMEGHDEWFGDGSMRQSAPISPAVHLGAERILVIGAGRLNEPAGRRAASASRKMFDSAWPAIWARLG
jgi:NTE family protein